MHALIFLALLLAAAALGLAGWKMYLAAGLAVAAVLALVFVPLQAAKERTVRIKPMVFYITGGALAVAGQLLWLVGFLSKTPQGAASAIGWGLCLIGMALAYLGTRTPAEGRPVILGSTVPAAAMALTSAAWCVWAWKFIMMTSVENPWAKGRVYMLFDDAMVSMRYGWNLAHGKGLVWNEGERVEGFTNFLQTILMAVGASFLDIYNACLFPQLLGCLAVIATGLAAYALVLNVSKAEGRARQGLAMLAFALTVFYYPLDYWSLEGMETGQNAAFLLWGFVLALDTRPQQGFRWPLVLVLGLATLTRPDALMAGFYILGLHGIRLLRQGQWKAALAQFAVLALFPAALTAFRLSYYGEWFPNTYFLKLTGLDRALRLESGWAYTRQFLPTVLPLMLLGGLGVIMRPSWAKTAMAVFYGIIIFYQVWIGGDAWLYWRFLAPVVPLLIVLALEGVFQTSLVMGRLLAKGGSPSPRFASAGLAAAALAGAVGLLVANKAFLKELTFKDKPFITDYNVINLNIAEQLKKLIKPGGSVGVTWAGTIPYFSQRKAIDFLGKCDKLIARRPADRIGFNGMPTVPGHNKYDLHYSIEELKPDYVQTEYWGGHDLTPYVKEHYTRITNVQIRNGSPHVDWERIKAEHWMP